MSQSGADVTLINYLVAMSGNHNQVERIFWQSALGQRRLNPQPGDKKKSLTYISDTIRNSFETFKSKLPELNPEIRATFERSLNDFNQSQGAQSSQGASQSDRKRTEWKRYNKDANPKAVPYLVKRIIPRVGVGTVAGPWGAFKSTIILELAFCVMTGEPFMGVHRIKRQGPVLFYGLESGDYVETQMQAIARHHGYSGDLPLYFVDSIPPLLSPNAEEELFASIKDAGIDDIAMIPIDTQGVAAGFTKDGQDNDTATNAQIMTTLKRLARRVDTVIIPVDHFGKNQELGTRGASAKEDHADFVLASLCDRAVGGALSNTRIALRKVRFGKSGS